MAKGTIVFIFFLAVLASLLFGINLGKQLGKSEVASTVISPTGNIKPTLLPSFTPPPSPTPIVSITTSPNTIPSSRKSGTTTFSDKTCGFEFSYPGSFIRQKTVNSQSVIFTDPDNPNITIAAACATSIPRPPVSSEKIEPITLGGVAAMLYHDQNSDGTPRDEIIAKHPTRELEIIIAGYGATFQSALSSFRFIQ